MRNEFIHRKESIFKIKNYCVHEPDFLIPTPEEITVD